MRTIFLLFWVASLVAAQSPEAGRIERSGDKAALVVESGRPIQAAALTLAEHFRIRVNVEDPPYIYEDDKVDVTAQVARGRVAQPVLVPRGGRLEVPFAVTPEGAPADPARLIADLVSAANAAFPFSYRVEQTGGAFTIIPTTTRDQLGNIVAFTPLLDRLVTIPRGKRAIVESANLLVSALSEQTGLQIGCCQGFVAGYPWGLEQVEFGADNEPARSVLRRLIAATLHGKPDRYFWTQVCAPLPSTWCFIHLKWITTPADTPLIPTQPPSDPTRWFDRATPTPGFLFVGESPTVDGQSPRHPVP